jgi:phasin family protein
MAKSAPHAFDPEFPKVPDFSKYYADFNRLAGDVGKLFVNGKAPLFDVEAAIASQRKNVEALTAANQVAFEGWQAVLRRQIEIARQAVEEAATLSKELTTGSAEDRIARQADAARTSYETAVANLRELAGLVQKASDEAVDVIAKRVVANLDEMKAVWTPKAAKK